MGCISTIMDNAIIGEGSHKYIHKTSVEEMHDIEKLHAGIRPPFGFSGNFHLNKVTRESTENAPQKITHFIITQ